MGWPITYGGASGLTSGVLGEEIWVRFMDVIVWTEVHFPGGNELLQRSFCLFITFI